MAATITNVLSTPYQQENVSLHFSYESSIENLVSSLLQSNLMSEVDRQEIKKWQEGIVQLNDSDEIAFELLRLLLNAICLKFSSDLSQEEEEALLCFDEQIRALIGHYKPDLDVDRHISNQDLYRHIDEITKQCQEQISEIVEGAKKTDQEIISNLNLLKTRLKGSLELQEGTKKEASKVMQGIEQKINAAINKVEKQAQEAIFIGERFNNQQIDVYSIIQKGV